MFKIIAYKGRFFFPTMQTDGEKMEMWDAPPLPFHRNARCGAREG